MPIRNPADLLADLPQTARIMGLDVGTKTIGLALSDTTRSIASPLETIRRTKFTADAAALVRLADKHGAAALVVGLPVNMDGSEGARCQSVRAFAANLLRVKDWPLAFWDERLSTAAVTRTLLEADLSRARRGELVDKMAAAYILQGFLDHLRVRR